MVNGSGKDGPKDSSQKDGSNDASRKRSSPVSEDQLKAMVSQQVQGALVNFLEQIGSQFQQVQGTLSALGDRLVGLEDLVQKTGKSSQDPAEIASPTKRGRPAPNSDGAVVLRELNDVASTFKKNLRDQVRRFCLSKDGHLYFTPQKHLFIGELSTLFNIIFGNVFFRSFGSDCEAPHESFKRVVGLYDGW